MWNQQYYAPDLPDLQLSYAEGDAITIQVATLQGDILATVNEQYAPSADDTITIRQLDAVAMAYIKPYDIGAGIPQLSSFTPAVNLTVTVTHADKTTTSYTTTIYYATIRTSTAAYPLTPSQHNGFLTTYTDRTITPAVPVIISYRSQLSASILVTYAQDGFLRSERLQLLSGSHAITVHCLSLAEITAMLNQATGGASVSPENIHHIRAELSSQDAVTDTINFHIDHLHNRQATAFLFTNCFGCPEAEVLTGNDHLTTSLDAELAYIDGKYRRAWEELEDIHKVSTGHITRQQYQSIRQLAQSPRTLILQADGSTEEATITAIDLSDTTPRSSTVSAIITYRIANRIQPVLNRPLQPPVNVFDTTFDPSFQ